MHFFISAGWASWITRGILLRIFIQLTSSFPLLAEIIPRPWPPMRHQANRMFGRNNYHAFHRLIPMLTGKTGKFGLHKNRQSSVSAVLRHVRLVQIYTAAIQMYSSGTLASVGITLIKMLLNHSVHKSKNFLYLVWGCSIDIYPARSKKLDVN